MPKRQKRCNINDLKQKSNVLNNSLIIQPTLWKSQKKNYFKKAAENLQNLFISCAKGDNRKNVTKVNIWGTLQKCNIKLIRVESAHTQSETLDERERAAVQRQELNQKVQELVMLGSAGCLRLPSPHRSHESDQFHFPTPSPTYFCSVWAFT